NGIHRSVAPLLLQPALEQTQRIVPEGIDLHRFATSRRHHPSVDLRVHPRELITLSALHEQAVARLDMNAEVRALSMVLDDPLESRKHTKQRSAIVRDADVASKSMKEPERRVRGVIQPFVASIREHVGNEPITDVMSERSQDESGLAVTSGDE